MPAVQVLLEFLISRLQLDAGFCRLHLPARSLLYPRNLQHSWPVHLCHWLVRCQLRYSYPLGLTPSCVCQWLRARQLLSARPLRHLQQRLDWLSLRHTDLP